MTRAFKKIECEKFYTEKLVPAVTNLGLSDITSAKLRWLRDEISLFLGEAPITPEAKHGLRLCEINKYRNEKPTKCWFHCWLKEGYSKDKDGYPIINAIVEFENGKAVSFWDMDRIRFLDTPLLPEVKE